MIVAKTSDRTTKNRANLISLGLGGLTQECFIVSGDVSTTLPANRVVRRVYVVAEELPEVINNKTTQCIIVEMLTNI